VFNVLDEDVILTLSAAKGKGAMHCSLEGMQNA